VRDEEGTQMGKVLSAFQSFLKSKIISSVDDRIGLIFYNVVRINF
jgi:ATP-dependent DNA helicase 2 subunit 1